MPIDQSLAQPSSEKIRQGMITNTETHNWRTAESGRCCNHLKWNAVIKTLPSGPGKLWRRGDRKIVRARGGGRHQANSVVQAQQDRCTHELVVTVVACPGPAHGQVRWKVNLISTLGSRSYLQLTPSCMRKICSLQGSLTGLINHTSGQVLCPELDDQCRKNSMVSCFLVWAYIFFLVFYLYSIISDFVFSWVWVCLSFLYFFFSIFWFVFCWFVHPSGCFIGWEREKGHAWLWMSGEVRRIWEELEQGNNDQSILYGNFSIKI